MKAMEVSLVEEVSVAVMPKNYLRLTQDQCGDISGSTPCARYDCQMRVHAWYPGVVGACREHTEDICHMFVIDVEPGYAFLRDSQFPPGSE
jgi:hypothetical protein